MIYGQHSHKHASISYFFGYAQTMNASVVCCSCFNVILVANTAGKWPRSKTADGCNQHRLLGVEKEGKESFFNCYFGLLVCSVYTDCLTTQPALLRVQYLYNVTSMCQPVTGQLRKTEEFSCSPLFAGSGIRAMPLFVGHFYLARRKNAPSTLSEHAITFTIRPRNI